MTSPDIISWIASILSTLSFMPQAILILKTKDTRSLSLTMWVISILATSFWVIFAYQIDNIGMLVADLIILVFTSIILFFKVKNVFKKVDKL
jgi:MtN3 and saliva related transmembrane protein